jgi:putative phage-type endonuclease
MTFNSLTIEDEIDLEETILWLIDEYIEMNKIHLSNEHFFENINTDIYDFLHESLSNVFIDNYNYEADEDDLKEWIEEHIQNVLDIYDIPERSSHEICVSRPPNYNTELIARQIEFLKSIPQPVQKTPEWYEMRHHLITASNIWKVFSTEATRNQLIYEKCRPLNMTASEYGKWNTESSLHWGIKYEPVSVALYEKLFFTKVGDFGCIQHPRHTFIGASPDGINICPQSERYGRMLEIKNIVNREITGVPLESYWIQIQMQMDTCGLDECDFFETRFKEYASREEFENDASIREHRGVMILFIDEANMPIYKYMPLSIRSEDIHYWTENTIREYSINNTSIKYCRTIYWYLDQFSCVLVKRNRIWVNAAIPLIESVWNTIVQERENGYEHRAPKKRAVKYGINETLKMTITKRHHTHNDDGTDDNSTNQLIHGNHFYSNPSITLVKLEA